MPNGVTQTAAEKRRTCRFCGTQTGTGLQQPTWICGSGRHEYHRARVECRRAAYELAERRGPVLPHRYGYVPCPDDFSPDDLVLIALARDPGPP